MCISAVCLSCLCDISERQLHNNNARGINSQLHARQLHINNCWGINCVIIPAPMVFRVGCWGCKNLARQTHGSNSGAMRKRKCSSYLGSSACCVPCQQIIQRLEKVEKGQSKTLNVGWSARTPLSPSPSPMATLVL